MSAEVDEEIEKLKREVSAASDALHTAFGAHMHRCAEAHKGVSGLRVDGQKEEDVDPEVRDTWRAWNQASEQYTVAHRNLQNAERRKYGLEPIG